MGLTEVQFEVEDDVSAALAEVTSERLAVQREQLKWLKEHRLYFYSPLPHQRAFHDSTARVKIAAGGNRSGKTTGGIIEDICLALGFRPFDLPQELKSLPVTDFFESPSLIPDFCKTPLKTPIKLLIIEDDWETADDILLSGNIDKAGKLTFYIPPEAIEYTEKNGMGYTNKYVLKNGSTIKIDTEKSFTNDPGSFEGMSYDVVHWDEPKKRDMRVAVKRGLVDSNGIEIFTLTPITEPWIKEEIWDKAGRDPNFAAFKFDTAANSHISAAGWEAFKASLTEDEIEARVKGNWVHLRGLVYKQFIPKAGKDGGHIIPPLDHKWIAEFGTVYVAIDPHPRQPMAALLMVADAKGRLIIWDELFVKELIPDFCTLLKSKLLWKNGAKTEELPVYWWMIDPIAFVDDPVDGGRWSDAFHDEGIPVVEAPKRKAHGIMETQQAFKSMKLFICENCTRTLYEIQRYVYEDWKASANKGEKEKPVDKDDHMMENMYRLVLINPIFVDRKHKTEALEVNFA